MEVLINVLLGQEKGVRLTWDGERSLIKWKMFLRNKMDEAVLTYALHVVIILFWLIIFKMFMFICAILGMEPRAFWTC